MCHDLQCFLHGYFCKNCEHSWWPDKMAKSGVSLNDLRALRCLSAAATTLTCTHGHAFGCQICHVAKPSCVHGVDVSKNCGYCEKGFCMHAHSAGNCTLCPGGLPQPHGWHVPTEEDLAALQRYPINP